MTFLQRILGILLFRPAAYRYVANDSSLTREAALIVFFMALLSSTVSTWMDGFGIRSATSFLIPIFSWIFMSWFCAWFAGLFKIKILFANILRALGYGRLSALFSIATLFFPSKSGLYSAAYYLSVLVSLIAMFLGIRASSSELSTGQAIALIFFLSVALTVLTWPLRAILTG